MTGLRLWSVVFDARDPVALARFWADALGWTHDGTAAVGGDGELQRLEFVPEMAPKQVQSWLHLDLHSDSPEQQQETVERFLALGGRHLDIGQGPDADHVVLADPEGNELCVLEPGNSFVDQHRLLGSLTCDGSPAVGYFWRDVLGWPLVWDQDDETAIRPPDGGLFITFGGSTTVRPARDRVRIHLAPRPGVDRDAEVARLIDLGATRLGDDDACVLLADPDGHELGVVNCPS